MRRIGVMYLCASPYWMSLCSGSLDDRVLLRELDDLVDIAEGKTRDRICTAVVDGDATRLSIVQSCARERHVGDVTHALILLTRRDEVRARAELYLPRLIKVKQR